MIYYKYPTYSYPPPITNQNMKYQNIMPNTKYQDSRPKNPRPNFNTHNNQAFRNKHIASTNKQFQNQTAYQAQEEVRKIKESSNKTDETALFEVFGIKLYFDDILLICLIFFLYNEGVQDQYLFIVLVLLLLS